MKRAFVYILSACSLLFINYIFNSMDHSDPDICIELNTSENSEIIKIKGWVHDENKQIIVGAEVKEKGTNNKSTTNTNGSFELFTVGTESDLIVSAYGFADQVIQLKKYNLNKPIFIILKSSTKDQITYDYEEDMSTDGISLSESSVKKEKKLRHAPPSVRVTSNMRYNEVRPIEEGNYTAIKENTFYNPLKDPLSTLSIDVDRASYSNVRRFIQQGNKPNPDAVRIEEMINYFNYNYEGPKKNADRPFSTDINLTECPWNKDHQLLHVGLQGQKIDREEIPASNLVFLLDVSGSMNNANKLPLLKSAFKLLVNQLDENDRIAIVVYAGAAGTVLESTPGNEKAKILESLNALRSGGSTAGAAGIQLAYNTARKHFIKGGNNRVILATDGDFNVGTSNDDGLLKLIEKEREDDIFLSVLGFGMGNYQDGKMQKIADAGNGNHSYIDNMQEAKKVLMDEFGGTLFTIAKDVKIQIEFNPAVVKGYRMVGYENRVLAAEDFNDDTKDAGEMGAGHTVTVLYEIIPVGSNSAFSKTIDDLKYQNNNIKTLEPTKELATIKYRYKRPTAKRSVKSEEIIMNKFTALDQVDNNVQWSAAVAEFGLLLRGSKYNSDGNYVQLIEFIKTTNRGFSDKYREEMLDLVEIASVLETN